MLRKFSPVLAVAALVLAGCGDTTGPRDVPLPDEPTEDVLFDFESADLGDPTAFDIVSGNPARPDQTSEWDFIFAIPSGGDPEFRPREVVMGEEAASGLQRANRSLEELREAPEDGYVTDEPIRVEEGDVLVGRSRQDPNFLTITCRHFMKLEVVSLDASAGTVTIRHLVNPNCNDRNLVAGSGGRG